MKILYALQGTGNGHLARALEIIPALRQFAEVDILVSGNQVDLSLPFELKYRLRGLSFIFGQRGGVDIWRSLRNAKLAQLSREIRQLPVRDYELVINDFEPISAWACRLRKVPCIALSHQAAVLHPAAPKPAQRDFIGSNILKYYAPAKAKYGYHFESYDEGIFTPIIRQEVRQQKVTKDGHYTVYLPAYGDQLLYRRLSQWKDIEWEVFSKHTKQGYRRDNIYFSPIHSAQFTASMAASDGVVCGAGFETPAEALHLGKKLLVIPMKAQYEQACNAAALQQMGVPVLNHLNELRLPKVEDWFNAIEGISVNYSDNAVQVVERVLSHRLEAEEHFDLGEELSGHLELSREGVAEGGL